MYIARGSIHRSTTRFHQKGRRKQSLSFKKGVLRLETSSESLVQPNQWFLLKNGFQKCPFEHTLYVREGSKGDVLIISLYVDDLIITGNNVKDIDEFKENMKQAFEMTDLGLLHFFLGLEIKQSSSGIFISQQKYARELLKRFRMQKANSVHYTCFSWFKIKQR